MGSSLNIIHFALLPPLSGPSGPPNATRRIESASHRRHCTPASASISAMTKSLSVASITLLSLSLHAGTNGFVVPHFRGLPGSTAGGWEVHSVSTNHPVGNLPDLPGNLAGARLVQLDPGAFVAGSGNIYNIGGVSSFIVRHEAPEPVGWVTFQAAGSSLSFDSATLDTAAVGVVPEPSSVALIVVGAIALAWITSGRSR